MWQFWEYDTFNEIQDVIRGISQESIDSIKTQEQEALQAQNFHQH